MPKWKGNTSSLYFEVEFHHDIKAGNFVAKITTYPLMREYVGDDVFTTPHVEKLKDTDLNQLREHVKNC